VEKYASIISHKYLVSWWNMNDLFYFQTYLIISLNKNNFIFHVPFTYWLTSHCFFLLRQRTTVK